MYYRVFSDPFRTLNPEPLRFHKRVRPSYVPYFFLPPSYTRVRSLLIAFARFPSHPLATTRVRLRPSEAPRTCHFSFVFCPQPGWVLYFYLFTPPSAIDTYHRESPPFLRRVMMNLSPVSVRLAFRRRNNPTLIVESDIGSVIGDD